MSYTIHNFPKPGHRRYRRQAYGIKTWLMILALVFAGSAMFYERMFPGRGLATSSPTSFTSRTGKLTGCQAARALGVAPMRRGDANYRPELDADGDGVACEPYP
ncbi:hypothetical protein DEM27_22175 [Metarhizobium album]|uniref:Excalibur calcium-binding domain-containing protein n=1 Tax=Metarhizobium album TaxID=2182425 RepID=A0A2U2DL47_9HYPH|nr:excalibur calcium-binding domain-containing protein [Rhizobium album]PWE54028.1 hypothetical protein DEM27_22175 [Rhizobium album]